MKNQWSASYLAAPETLIMEVRSEIEDMANNGYSPHEVLADLLGTYKQKLESRDYERLICEIWIEMVNARAEGA